MATETPRTEKTLPKQRATRPRTDPFTIFWDDALTMQRQWFNFWTRPMGFTTTPEDLRDQMHDFNKEWLDHTERTTTLGSTLVSDQATIAREFSEKLFEMIRTSADKDPKELTPDFTREWIDTTRRSAERMIAFGNDSMKAIEDFGLRATETMAWIPASMKP